MPAPAHFDTVFFWHRAVFFWHRAVFFWHRAASFWHRSFWHRLVLIFLVVSAIAGCTGGGPTAEQQLEAAFAGNSEARLNVAKFEGTVTFDGQQPGKDHALLQILLVDADKFQDPKHAARWQAPVDESGHFAFSTYLKDDGAPVGKYVAVFFEPEVTTRVKGSGRTRSASQGFGGAKAGADKLKNLYNDPEQNLKNPAFLITLQPPGITNQTFNLELAGAQGPAVPGKFAITDAPVAGGGFKFQ
jgi:hypothetical protein